MQHSVRLSLVNQSVVNVNNRLPVSVSVITFLARVADLRYMFTLCATFNNRPLLCFWTIVIAFVTDPISFLDSVLQKYRLTFARILDSDFAD